MIRNFKEVALLYLTLLYEATLGQIHGDPYEIDFDFDEDDIP